MPDSVLVHNIPPGPIGIFEDVAPGDLEDDAFEYIQGYFDIWEPTDGNLEVVLIGAIAELLGVLYGTASETGTEIFRYFGTLAGVPPLDPAQASGDSTWTMVDDAGYIIPAGTQLGIVGLDGDDVGFQTVEDVTVPNGETATDAGEVLIEAIDPGINGTDLSGDIEVISPQLAYVESAVVVGVTQGGTDGELEDEYLARLAAALSLQAPRPILPQDFADIYRINNADVDRAVAIDGYNADDETEDNERCVTVFGVDVDGEPLSGAIKSAAEDDLRARREVNFLVFVDDPVYTEVAVDFTAVALPGFDLADVKTEAEAAVAAFLSPSNFGGSFQGNTWVNDTKIRHYDLIAEIDHVPGINYVTLVKLAEDGDTTVAADLDLDGIVPLPRAGTIVGTVTAS
jgi:hypothetical protein